MNPNKTWECIIEDISLLHDMVSDEDYASRISWADGTTIDAVRSTLCANLDALAEYIRKGGNPPAPFEDLGADHLD